MHESGPQAVARPQMRRAVWAATIGCGLEFYDFLTFAFFAIQIGEAFFPSESRYLSLMGSLATFGAGFVARPIGAYVLGGIADRRGRRGIMLFSMVLMGSAIAVLALTPGYASIGIFAPIIAILCRLAQGFALGGEVGAATVYMVEAAPIEKRGLAASLQGVAQNAGASIGALVAFLLSIWLSDADFTAYGWRIAMLIGVSVVPFAIVVRRSLPETLGNPEPEITDGKPGPTLQRVVILGMLIIGSGTIATYIFDYMATFGQTQLALSPKSSLAGQLANNVAGTIACVIGGILCDRYGRRPMQMWPQLLFCLTIVPCFLWLTSIGTVGLFIGINIILSILNNLSSAPLYVALAESLDSSVRSRAFSLIYALPVAFLGGSTQPFITWLLEVTGNAMSIAWYLTGVSIVGLVAILILPESAPIRRGWKAATGAP